MKKKAEKHSKSEELRSQLATVSTVILSTFQGITVEQDTKLRRSVEAAGGHYEVVKNTVAERDAGGRLAQESEGHEFDCVHKDRPGGACQDFDEDRKGRSSIPIPRGIRRRA